jgi:ABC-type amino acid transport substrate-binding protein
MRPSRAGLVLLTASSLAILFSVMGYLYVSGRSPESIAPVTEMVLPASDSERVLRARGDWGYPPFEFLDEEGKPTGFNVEILRRLAEVMNLNVEISLGP